jgi:predicted homoserine dehydrogenase-like protein
MREELLRRQAEGRPIRLGVSGAGWMGSGFVAQVAHVPSWPTPTWPRREPP